VPVCCNLAAKIFTFFNFTIEEPLRIGNILLSFWGHFGVQVFIILSAYGIFVSHFTRQTPWWSFIKQRYIKLYPSLVFAVFIFIFFQIYGQDFFVTNKTFIDIFWHLTTLAGFIPGKAEALNGPWWFFSLIFQVYALIHVIMYFFRKHGTSALLVIAGFGYAITIAFHSFLLEHNLNILHTVFGHLPEVVFGVWLASKKAKPIAWWVLFIALIVFIAGNFWYGAWFFSHLSAGVLLLWALLLIIRATSHIAWLTKLMGFFGEMSLYIFAIHGFLRWEFVGRAAYRVNLLSDILHALFFLLVVATCSYLFMRFDHSFRSYVAQGKSALHKWMRFLIPIVLIICFFYVLRYENKNYGKWLAEREQQQGVE
jgi:peptidoglycan/LPS O-acetylase OafA/YrhL